MIICDRCKNKIIKKNDNTTKTLTIYSRQAAYIGHYVDLCDDCLRKFGKYMGKAESYFMVNKGESVEIFDDVKYWMDD